jgi:hypothetical protein
MEGLDNAVKPQNTTERFLKPLYDTITAATAVFRPPSAHAGHLSLSLYIYIYIRKLPLFFSFMAVVAYGGCVSMMSGTYF